MKKFLHVVFAVIIVVVCSNLVAAQENRHGGGIGNGPALKYGNDIIIHSMSGVDQENVKLAVAFNGWLYTAFTIKDAGANTSTGMVRMSKDNGLTWTEIDSYTISGGQEYYDYEIVVAGTDTNDLVLYVAGLRRNSTSEYILFLDMYNGRTGDIIGGSAFFSSRTGKIYDVALATDYRFPSGLSSPYSVALTYSTYNPVADSLFYAVSIDGGATFANPVLVQATANYYGKVSLSYGRCSNYFNGRYYIAYEQKKSSLASMGNVFLTHNTTYINGTWTKPKCLDSIEMSYVFGKVCNPKVSTQFNDVDNDSSQFTAIVLMDRAWDSVMNDRDIIGYYNKKAVNTDEWIRFDISNSTLTNDIQSDIKFDPTFNNFLVTYFDSTDQKLPYLVQGQNLATPGTWVTISAKYNDAGGMQAPYPVVEINPLVTKAAFVWSAGQMASGVATFDAEYVDTGIGESSADNTEQTVYPSPVTHIGYLNFTTNAEQDVVAGIYNLSGQKVLDIANQKFENGNHTLSFDVSTLESGLYLCKIQSGSTQKTVKFSVIH